MTRVRLAAVLWLLLAVAVWNAFLDLYVSRGAREYLQLQAEFELGRGPRPDMTDVMARNTRAGAIAASVWAILVGGGGWLTIVVVRSRREPEASAVRS